MNESHTGVGPLMAGRVEIGSSRASSRCTWRAACSLLVNFECPWFHQLSGSTPLVHCSREGLVGPGIRVLLTFSVSIFGGS